MTRPGSVMRFLVATVRRFLQDGGPHRSAAIAYYALLSFGPSLILCVWVVARFTGSSPEALDALLQGLARLLPPQQQGALDEFRRGFHLPEELVLAMLPLLVWTALLVFLEVESAVSAIFRLRRSRRVLVATAKSFGLFLLSAALLVASFLAHQVLLTLTASGMVPLGRWVMRLAGILLPLGVTVLLFAFIYGVLPQTRVGFRPALAGGLVAGGLWETAKHLFGMVTARAPTYGILYGPVSLLVVLLAWAYLSAAILLLGAEAVALRREGPLEKNPALSTEFDSPEDANLC